MEHPGYLSSRFSPAALRSQVRAAIARHDVVVLVHHHWECLWPGETKPGGFLEQWRALLADLANSPALEFVTFGRLYDRLRSRR